MICPPETDPETGSYASEEFKTVTGWGLGEGGDRGTGDEEMESQAERGSAHRRARGQLHPDPQGIDCAPELSGPTARPG